MATMFGDTVMTPWGKTSVWMRPKPVNPVYAVNPWALLEEQEPVVPEKPQWRCDAKPFEYNPPPCGMMATVPLMVTPDLMKFVIGREGSVFKAITHQVKGAQYIWYHKGLDVIEIWALNSKALNNIENRLVNKMLLIQQEHMKQTVECDWASVTE